MIFYEYLLNFYLLLHIQEKHKCLSLESKIADFEDQISRITIEKNELFEKLQEEKKLKIILNSEIIKLKENYNQAHNAEVVLSIC